MTDQPDTPASGGRSRPRYLELADDLAQRIDQGEFAPGEDGAPTPLPAISELAVAYDVAPGTARSALANLRSRGLVDMKQGQGTFVRTWRPILRDANKRLSSQHWGSGKSVWAADLAADQKLDVVDIAVETTTAAPARYRQILGADRIVVRDRVFTVDKKRVQWARSYLPADLVAGTAITEHETGAGGTPARMAELGFPYLEYAEEVEVRRPTLQEQSKLAIPGDEPVAHIVRLNAGADGRVLEVTDMVAVGEAYRFRWAFSA